mgnify:FL=1
MIIKRNVILGLIFLSMFSAIPLRAEEIHESAAISAPSSSEPGMKMEEGEMKHEDMNKDKEHEGMYGMMMGHHMKGWWIVIGVVMVIMMGAHVAVLF